MPRVRLRKTLQSDLSRYKDAYKEVKAGELPRKAADKRGTDHCCLLRYLRKRHASVIVFREKSGVNAPVTNSGLTRTAQKAVSAEFSAIET
ncbi:hypothetical protein EVAR_92556_1 [Eumeta japonica]|uniref:Uncharacterized protein n=1 Tax=Eumeta variegata TaxID=151549 RepID=A0A4C1SWK2_EUMVA|nr:hypothetical protein EVAR_92556_1 [Eumeta japonica]